MSPFDPPLIDDTGGFVLGPNTQHDTSRDYVQRYDRRGHPVHVASHEARLKLIRAQNEALETVGVVIRKARMDRSRWQTMNDEQKYRLLLDENTMGAYCGIVESILQKLSTRWILNFRRRLLVSHEARKIRKLLTHLDIQILPGSASAPDDLVRVEHPEPYTVSLCRFPFCRNCKNYGTVTAENVVTI